jgi:hypothetical protein
MRAWPVDMCGSVGIPITFASKAFKKENGLKILKSKFKFSRLEFKEKNFKKI